jgi:hypothetical protein
MEILAMSMVIFVFVAPFLFAFCHNIVASNILCAIIALVISFLIYVVVVMLFGECKVVSKAGEEYEQ